MRIQKIVNESEECQKKFKEPPERFWATRYKVEENKTNLIINKISKIRKNNNKQWMNILRLAFKNSPEEAKKIFKKITKNDKAINKLSKELCE